MDDKYSNTPVDYPSTLARVKSSLRFILQIQRRHCPADLFHESWLAQGVFGHLSTDGVLVFHGDIT